MTSVEHIPVVWIPAIHAGMTLLLKQLYNQENFVTIQHGPVMTVPLFENGRLG